MPSILGTFWFSAAPTTTFQGRYYSPSFYVRKGKAQRVLSLSDTLSIDMTFLMKCHFHLVSFPACHSCCLTSSPFFTWHFSLSTSSGISGYTSSRGTDFKMFLFPLIQFKMYCRRYCSTMTMLPVAQEFSPSDPRICIGQLKIFYLQGIHHVF